MQCALKLPNALDGSIKHREAFSIEQVLLNEAFFCCSAKDSSDLLSWLLFTKVDPLFDIGKPTTITISTIKPTMFEVRDNSKMTAKRD